MRSLSRLLLALCAAAAAFSPGCATVGSVANIDDGACRATLSQAISTILVGEHESPATADGLAGQAVERMVLVHQGPRPFVVPSPSGTDYFFFIQLKRTNCLLRLYGRQKGFWSYTNDLTYIATQPLPGCTCSG